MTFNDVVNLSTTAVAGQVGFFWPLACNTTTSGGAAISVSMPRLNTMAALYRQFTIKSFTVEYVPAVGSTDKGMLAMGFDPSPLAGNPTGFSSIVRHSVAKMFDIKTNVSLTYRPAMDKKKDPRYTTSQAGFGEDEYSFGVLQLYTTGNSVPASTIIGFLRFSASVEFIGPN